MPNTTRGRLLAGLLLLSACSTPPSETPSSGRAETAKPSIVLVTLDTTRADAVGPETPHLQALAERGLRFRQAYATAPMTLPSHASMMTGLLPAEHGIHENARRLADEHAVAAERLRDAGYATAAVVSGYPLDRQFGLARGFDVYDDDLGDDGAAERTADVTVDRALAFVEGTAEPFFLWVHLFDPHEPYEPPAPFDGGDLYLGEVAFMDRELGRLLDVVPDAHVIVAGDHGEGRGEHGETLHGNLLYQGVMRVPLIVAGPGVRAGVREEPVSIRRIFDTLLGWAGEDAPRSLLNAVDEVALGEAMKPFLQYGWQPQVLGVRGSTKVIRAGTTEVYDAVADPAETSDLGTEGLDRELAKAVEEYPLPSSTTEAADLSDAEREKLASLGYFNWDGEARVDPDAPRPADMTDLFADLDLGSGLFVRRDFARAIPVFERVAARDPKNLVVCLRLAVASSVLGRDKDAMRWFGKAEQIDPDSVDLRHYLGMHHFAAGNLDEAAPLLESVLVLNPERLPALEALSRLRAEQGRLDEAVDLLERAVALKRDPGALLVKLGEVHMARGDTTAAILAYERARDVQGEDFKHHLELGVCYLADHQPEAARDCLDLVPEGHPAWPMVLFKRAQVSVLLGEADSAERIRQARDGADDATRRLIDNETLFRQ